MRIGDVRIDPLIDGELVVPGSTFYQGTTEADWLGYDRFLEPVFHEATHLNTLGGYLLRSADRVVVVDCGIGPSPTAPFVGGGFRSALAALGVARGEVTDVIFTHLHFDHLGWASVDGRPFFPGATYRMDRRDWDYYCAPEFEMTELEASYCDPEKDAPKRRLAPVEDRIEFFEGEQEILPGLDALEASGHTPGETAVEIVSGGETGLLLGDVVHAQPELIDDQPVEKWCFLNNHDQESANAAVERIRRRVADERIPFAAAHFAGLRWARIEKEHGRRSWVDLPV